MKLQEPAEAESLHLLETRISYQTVIRQLHSGRPKRCWLTWSIVLITSTLWIYTAYQAAVIGGATSLVEIISHIANNAVTIQSQDSEAIAVTLLTFGAKYNELIYQGEYWRFVTPIFLHANALHLGLNMFNLLFLGRYLERIAGPTRLLFIYLITGIISVIASVTFAPEVLSIGASGAIFGIVGAYSTFIFMHRQALPKKGMPAIGELVFIIGINLSLGLMVDNIDNYAHIGGLLSGFLVGWYFMPYYRLNDKLVLVDSHSLTARWPLALFIVLGTFLLICLTLWFPMVR